MKKFFFISILIITVVTIIGVIYLQKNVEIQSKTVAIQEKELIKAVYASGIVEPKNQIDVKSEVSGYIKKLYITEGQHVKKEQIIAIIKNIPIEKEIKKIKIRIKYLEDKLKPDSLYRKTFETKINAENYKLELLKKKLEKRKPLAQKNHISKEEIETLENKINIQKQIIESLKTNYTESIKKLEEKLEILKIQYEKLLAEKDRYYIRAKTDGTVLKLYVKEGDYINHMVGQNKIATLGNVHSLKTVLNVDEEYIGLIKEGMEVLVTADPFPDRVFKGKIIKVSKIVNPQKRTVQVEAIVNYPKDVPSQLTVEANIIVSRKKINVLPIEFIKEGKVKIRKGKRIMEVPVKTGITNNGFVEVKNLKKGTQVIQP